MDDNWPLGVSEFKIKMNQSDIEIVNLLLSLDQSHLFKDWQQMSDDNKSEFLKQVKSLHASYLPEQGGLGAYIRNSRILLQHAKSGVNPMDGWSPVVPNGEVLSPSTEKYDNYHKIGVSEVPFCGFVLVAGGLGERLGYHGIKISLPTETITNTCYIQLYINQILSIQSKYGCGICLPLAIMVSDDTEEKTITLLRDHNNFGMNADQITILKQEKVPALIDNDAHISLDGSKPHLIETKPHGHGDVHALMYSTGTARKWLDAGIKWCYFFQDTNGLLLYALSATLGVSVSLDLQVNSVAIPRFAKQDIGAIAKLVHSDGREITVNVEYNQLDPLLRSTVAPEGDTNDSATGHSPYPGNINQLLFRLKEYESVLQVTHGVMGEFVNPKYADAGKNVFKKPTRLECMMQDYPKALSTSAKVGFTIYPTWFTYCPVKNNTVDALSYVARGLPPACALSGECGQYNIYRELLKQRGCTVESCEPQIIRGIQGMLYPQIVFHPNFCLFPSDFVERFPTPSDVHISKRSSLIVSGNVIIEKLDLDGALRIEAPTGMCVRVNIEGVIRNNGYEVEVLDEMTFQASDGTVVSEAIAMRGFRIVKHEDHDFIRLITY